MSIRQRLVLLTVALFAPALLAAALMLQHAYDRERAALERRMSDTARALSLAVDRQLGQGEAQLVALGTSPALDPLDPGRFHAQARAVAPHGRYVVLFDRAGRQVVNGLIPFDDPLPTVADPYAAAVAAGGRPVVSGVIESMTTGRRVVAIDVPVRRDHVARLVIAPAEFRPILSQQGLPAGWTAVILDERGTIVARSRDPDVSEGQSVTPDFLARIEGQAEGLFKGWAIEGDPTLVAFSRSPTYGWVFAIAAPRAQIVGQAQRPLLWIVFGGLALGALGALGALIVGRGIARPIEALTQRAALLGQGQAVPDGRLDLREAQQVLDTLQEAGAALRRREAGLRESEVRFRVLADSAPALIWMSDADGRVIFANRHYETMFGQPPEAFLGDGWRTIVHPDDVEGFSAAFQAAFQARAPFQADVRVTDRHGHGRWLHCEGAARFDGAGEFLGYTGCNVDVTDAKLAETSLRASNVELQEQAEETTRERNRIFEISNDLFGVGDYEGRLKLFNPAWERLLGYAPEAMTGRRFRDLIHPDDHAEAAAVVAALRRGESIQNFEDRMIRADGSVCWLSWNAVPAGDLFYVVGRDITAEKEQELALAAATERLNAEIEDRQRAEAALVQSQKMEALGRLTGGVAHDFNNLLAIIDGNIDMALRRVTDERAAERLRRSQQAAERATKLTQQLLAFARRQALQPQVIDLNARVRAMADLMIGTLGATIRVETDLADDLWPVRVDPNQLELAVLNLAVNARDAMPDGGVLTVSTRALASPRAAAVDPALAGDFVALSLADTGSGMAPEVIGRAFEPFFTTKGDGRGTGLGLSMVYGFARQSGGVAAIDSRPGGGATVTLYLPRSHEAPAAAAPAATGPRTADEPASVLVVEDNPEVAELTEALLTEAGHTVLRAAGGQAALDLLRRPGTRVDLIVTDVMMPGMTGLDLAAQVRAEQPALPIVLATGYSDAAARGEAQGYPILLKPFSSDALLRMVALHARRSEPAEA